MAVVMPPPRSQEDQELHALIEEARRRARRRRRRNAAIAVVSERLALLRAAGRLPGVSVNPHARDALGRRGVSIAGTLIYDPETGAILAGPKGTILAQGVVNSPYALPTQAAPVRVVGGPPVPALLAIAPQTASPTTALRVTLTHANRHKAPALDWVLAGTPR